MAIVFISPKKRQKAFFIAISAILVLFFILFSISIIPSEPKKVSPKIILNKTNIEINTSIFNQDKFKKLQPFSDMKKQFSYRANTKNKKLEEGVISAESADEVREVVEGFGWSVLSIKEIEVGREDPFSSY
jgi:hypothetical protein